MSNATRVREDALLAAAAQKSALGRWVCAYLPLSDEPGTVAFVDGLRSAGARVLVPVTGPPGPLSWAEYTGADALRPGRFGVSEPTNPVLGPAAIERAASVVVPALAVDRRGVRLGRGAGYYDRTLPGVRPGTRLIALVRDEEIVAELPSEPHDVRMSWAWTPRRGLVELAAQPPAN